MDETKFNPLLLGVAVIALIAAALLFINNRSLDVELDTLRATRTALEGEAKAANERATVAQRSVDETKAEMDKVKVANEEVNHSVTQLRNQLEQVQIQSNTAREDFEKRLNASADELRQAQSEAQRLTEEAGKAGAAKQEADKQLQSVRDDAERRVREVEARLQAEVKKAQEDLTRERSAREEAEKTVRETSNGATGGVPPTSP
jgi:chromosome segregation ATPase